MEVSSTAQGTPIEVNGENTDQAGESLTRLQAMTGHSCTASILQGAVGEAGRGGGGGGYGIICYYST